MGKVIAREFIWLIITLIASLPLGVVFLWFFGYTHEAVNLTETQRSWVFWLYLIGYFSAFIGIYIMRFVAISIKTLSQKEEAPAEE